MGVWGNLEINDSSSKFLLGSLRPIQREQKTRSPRDAGAPKPRSILGIVVPVRLGRRPQAPVDACWLPWASVVSERGINLTCNLPSICRSGGAGWAPSGPAALLHSSLGDAVSCTPVRACGARPPGRPGIDWRRRGTGERPRGVPSRLAAAAESASLIGVGERAAVIGKTVDQ